MESVEKIMKLLTDLGTEGVQRTIEGYTRWYLVSAICWFVAGILVIITGWKIQKPLQKHFEDNQWIKYIISGVIIAIGYLLISYNLSTICAPEAYAIYNLINDVK